MSATEARTIVTGVDFVSIPTSDLERAVAFYGETLGLHRSAHRPDRNFAYTRCRRGPTSRRTALH